MFLSGIYKRWIPAFAGMTRCMILKSDKLNMSPVESLKTQNKFKKTEIGEIPVDWPITKISELCEVNPYYQIPKGIKCAYIEMPAVTANRPDILYFKERIAGETGGTRFKNGDTLFARIT